MKKTLIAVFFLFAAFLMNSAYADFFSEADAFMKKNVSAGSVDYEGIKAAPAELDALVKQIAAFPYKTSDSHTQKAFAINAYNILVIQNVVDHYPLKKPTDVDGFFDKIKFTIAGMSLTLSEIENKVIRPTFKDPRVHFALVCAAKSCPPLPSYAFSPSNVESKLEAITRAAMNNKQFIKVDDNAKKVELSMILEWYKDDFLTVSKSQLEYVNKYRDTAIPSSYKQSFYEYNWQLNLKKK